jgi:hypothetical protein
MPAMAGTLSRGKRDQAMAQPEPSALSPAGMGGGGAGGAGGMGPNGKGQQRGGQAGNRATMGRVA